MIGVVTLKPVTDKTNCAKNITTNIEENKMAVEWVAVNMLSYVSNRSFLSQLRCKYCQK